MTDYGQVHAFRTRYEKDEVVLLAAKACSRRLGVPFGAVVVQALAAWLVATPTGVQYQGDFAAIARLPEATGRGRITGKSQFRREGLPAHSTVCGCGRKKSSREERCFGCTLKHSPERFEDTSGLSTYFFYAPGDRPSAVKIGRSSNIYSRTKELRVDFPSGTMVRIIGGDFEHELHVALSSRRFRHGEWFRVDDEVRAVMAALTQADAVLAVAGICSRSNPS